MAPKELNIEEKTPIKMPIVNLITLLALTAGMLSSYKINDYKIEQLEEWRRTEEASHQMELQEHNKLKSDVAVVTERLVALTEALNKLTDKLERLLERR